jgi:tetratricopeptide (TPR) repeat protein
LKPRFALILMLLPATLFVGCVSQDQIDSREAVADYLEGGYPRARQLLEPLAKKTNEDFVLNNVRLGSTNLALYDIPGSQAAFLTAYEVLNSYGVNTGGRTLGAVLVDEKIKIWRGEPFERAMANFYLGLTYYIQADYNNARAAFENALFKLHDYGADPKAVDADKFREVDSNFILAQYMLGRCYQRLGKEDVAASNFNRVVSLAPQLAALSDPAMNKRSNVLLIVDYGKGPYKATTADGAISGFVPTPEMIGPPPRPDVMVDGGYAFMANPPLVDLILLAQDQRWQSIDTIRTIKTVLGSGLIAGGAYEALTARRSGDAAIGLGLIAAGALLKASSQADTRVWGMLPRSTYAIPLTLTPGKHDVTVSFPSVRQTLAVNVPNSGETTCYFRVLGSPVYIPVR